MFLLIFELCHFSLSLLCFLVILSAVALLVGEKVQEETTLVVSCGTLPGQWEDVTALQWVIEFSLRTKHPTASYIDVASPLFAFCRMIPFR